MLSIHPEILDQNRQEIFQLLTTFKDRGYLAGGTALALQICHRKSYDFDIFIDRQIEANLLAKIKRVFKKVTFTLNTPNQVNFFVRGGINVTFFKVEHKLLFPAVKTGTIELAYSRDIAANKAYTIGRRATWRDYVDMFFILKTGIATLPQIIAWGKKKFSGEFVETLFLEQLVYFDDLKMAPIEYLQETPTEEEIKKFLGDQVTKVLRSARDSDQQKQS